jgi:heme-degrading monooxygenase HmoA
MVASPFASTPKPPYFAVIFSSQRRADDGSEYGVTADRMVELAAQQPGYLGVESTRGPDGFGITVSYWDSEAAILAWRRHAEHTLARERGRSEWYEHFELRVAQVTRAYAGP